MHRDPERKMVGTAQVRLCPPYGADYLNRLKNGLVDCCGGGCGRGCSWTCCCGGNCCGGRGAARFGGARFCPGGGGGGFGGSGGALSLGWSGPLRSVCQRS